LIFPDQCGFSALFPDLRLGVTCGYEYIATTHRVGVHNPEAGHDEDYRQYEIMISIHAISPDPHAQVATLALNSNHGIA
jgi:hypothetical protein